MFDILLYLYDTYMLADQIPDAEHLSRKLSAAGFEEDEIAEALDWLAGLDELVAVDEAVQPRGIRIYSLEEERRLDTEGRGFLAFLESANLLPPHGREWVIEQALALPDPEIPASRIKWIAMLALWKLKGAGDVLWLEDLVRGAEEGRRPTFH
ncbi:MAG: DUF494 domain-containing protein [Thiobacillus sp.]|nr:DUF494 domain-containing protein [Thiobacillus sp.]